MLQVKNLSFSAGVGKNSVNILNDLNLNIQPGEFIVITGPNGSGKSTLAKLLMGLEQASKGKILFNGEDITDKTITERANLGIAISF
ncbi:MAG: ATP-binding cassette domain-containing protein, partial [Candidatus Saccharibacteria bacterium]|nr:ATP-binding cassette domain-containing protein [Candidatus Saccharibacteria bacterium]